MCNAVGADGFTDTFDGYLVGTDRSKDLAVLKLFLPEVIAFSRMISRALPVSTCLCEETSWAMGSHLKYEKCMTCLAMGKTAATQYLFSLQPSAKHC